MIQRRLRRRGSAALAALALVIGTLTAIVLPQQEASAAGTCNEPSITWTGADGNDWNNTANWDPSEALPNSNDDVCIPNTLFGPILSSGTAQVRSIVGETDTTVSVSGSATLTIGTDSGLNGLIVSDTATVEHGAKLDLDTLTMNGGTVADTQPGSDPSEHEDHRLTVHGQTVLTSSTPKAIHSNLRQLGTFNWYGGDLDNSGGRIDVEDASTFSSNAVRNLKTDSITFASSGWHTLMANVDGPVELYDGRLSLQGSVLATLLIEGGIFTPGAFDSTHTLPVGTFQQFGGTVLFDVEGVDPGEWDQITTNANISVGTRQMEVRAPGNFSLEQEAFLDLMTAPSVTATWQVNKVFPVGYTAEVTTGADNVRLHITPPEPETQSISGHVMVDVNGDGVLGTDDTEGMDDLTVFVDANDNGAFDQSEYSAPTTDGGYYQLNDIPAGTHNVAVELPEGWFVTTLAHDSVVVAGGQTVSNVDFGVFRVASITGVVFNDVNGDFIKGPGESGLADVRVYIDDDASNDFTPAGQSGDRSVLTNEEGEYQFGDLLPQNNPHRVAVVVPDNWERTTPAPPVVNVQSGSHNALDFGLKVKATTPTTQPPTTEPPTTQPPTTQPNTPPPAPGISAPIKVNPDGTVVDVPVTPSPDPSKQKTASTPTGLGSWTVAPDGGVFTAGDAPFFGSMGGLPLNSPIVNIAPTATGAGYLLVASDGGVFAYGDANFQGSMGGQPLNAPVTGIAESCDQTGYYLVAADGGVFAFGEVGFHGSMGGKPLNREMIGVVDRCGGDGYWTFAADGGVFAYGDAQFYGSLGSNPPAGGIIGMVSAPDGNGYWLIGADRRAYGFGSVAPQ